MPAGLFQNMLNARASADDAIRYHAIGHGTQRIFENIVGEREFVLQEDSRLSIIHGRLLSN